MPQRIDYNMSNDHLIQLFPPTGALVELTGLYLTAALETAPAVDRPFVYSNFVTSLDGRIAVPAPDGDRSMVPPQVANPRDWRLFQELAARADVLLVSGRYLRELAHGQAQDVLPLSPAPQFADLHAWRRRQALPPQPDVAIFSASLDFPLPAAALAEGRRLWVFTAADAPIAAERRLRAAGVDVVRAGDAAPPTAAAIAYLGAQGYRRLYSIAGPLVLHSLLRAGLLNSLFLTTVQRCLGGPPLTISEGPLLAEAVNFRLAWLYYDDAAAAPAGQLLARYDRSE